MSNPVVELVAKALPEIFVASAVEQPFISGPYISGPYDHYVEVGDNDVQERTYFVLDGKFHTEAIALAIISALEKAGYRVVEKEPTEAMRMTGEPR